jgi:hypothetical protein
MGPAAVDLYWIPLGAGAHVVRLCGRLYEEIAARAHRRPRQDLYHSALVIDVPAGRFVIEMTPVVDGHGEQRGVVVEGPVGVRWGRRVRWLRYEIRRWRGGTIPDIEAAVDSPVRVTDDLDLARRVVDLVPHVPAMIWGRDRLAAGDMWNSNSVVSWLLVRGGIDVAHVRPPRGGRAPGWEAGVVAAGGADGSVPESGPSALRTGSRHARADDSGARESTARHAATDGCLRDRSVP